MQMYVRQDYVVTIPDDTRHHEIVEKMEQNAKEAGYPYSAEDLEPQVLRADMAMYLIDHADSYADLVRKLDYAVREV